MARYRTALSGLILDWLAPFRGKTVEEIAEGMNRPVANVRRAVKKLIKLEEVWDDNGKIRLVFAEPQWWRRICCNIYDAVDSHGPGAITIGMIPEDREIIVRPAVYLEGGEAKTGQYLIDCEAVTDLFDHQVETTVMFGSAGNPGVMISGYIDGDEWIVCLEADACPNCDQPVGMMNGEDFVWFDEEPFWMYADNVEDI